MERNRGPPPRQPPCGALSSLFLYADDRGFGSAADAKMLPQPKPRAMSELFIMPAIGSRDVACAEGPNIRRFEHLL